ncbi:MAG TPA: MATE family efflux transporter [candidate division Zixibacteria bacterium]|nr:MATE family efflux transporter [candidate division Zixibacteria bacterium]
MTNRNDNILNGPITRAIFSLALPVVLNMFMEFALASTDYFWVGKLGAMAQDAVTSSMVVIWTMFATTAIVSVGVTALVSRYVGARDLDRVRFYLGQGIKAGLLLSFFFGASGFIFTPAALRFMDTGPETMIHAVPYLRIFFASAVFFFINEICYSAFRASGDTRTPAMVAALVIVINMALDPLLIFGWGPIPSMGVTGASLATGIAISIGSMLILRRMFRGGLGYDVSGMLRNGIDLRSLVKIGKIGLPMSSQQFVFVIVYWFLIKIVHQFGEVAAAAMGIGNRMESFSYLTCFGFSVAASTMVGQNLGARQPDRAARSAWGAAGTAICITFIIGGLFIVIPDWIASIFTDNPEVKKIAIDYLFILGISQSAMAIEIVLEGAFGGAGDTIPPMVVSIPGALMRIPMAYYFCFNLDWGINGVWWTLTITSIIKALIMAGWFRLGRWKTKEL